MAVKPVYYANAAVAATASSQQAPFKVDGSPSPRNGLLEIGGATFVMNLAVLGFDDPEIKARVVASGGKGNFTIRMFPTPASAAVQTALPLVMIEATEPDPDSATKTVELAASQVDPVLVQIQRSAGVPESQYLRAIKASSPKAVAGIPKRNKTLAVTLMAGAAAAVSAALLVDFSANRWKGRRRERTA